MRTKFCLFAVMTVLMLILFAVPSLADNNVELVDSESYHGLGMQAGFSNGFQSLGNYNELFDSESYPGLGVQIGFINGFQCCLDILPIYFEFGFTEDTAGLAMGMNYYFNDANWYAIYGPYVGAGIGFNDDYIGVDLRAGYKLWIGDYFFIDGGASTVFGAHLNFGFGY